MNSNSSSKLTSPDSSVANLSALLATMPKAVSPNNTSGERLTHPPSGKTIAEHLQVLPPYKREEKERWTSAAAMYAEMLSSHGGSPEQSPNTTCCNLTAVNSDPRFVNSIRTPDPYEKALMQRQTSWHQSQPKRVHSRENSVDDLMFGGLTHHGSLPYHPHAHKLVTRSFSGMVTPSRLGGLTMSTANSRGELQLTPTSLELEAIAAVHELSFAVDMITVSDMLPRTAELIFVNVTTVEGQTYCLELTFKGWRVCSRRHDCMNCDYTQMALHTRYYDTVYAVMDDLSEGYRQRFGEKLASRLRMLQQQRTDNLSDPHLVHGDQPYLAQAPASSYAQLPKLHELMEKEKKDREAATRCSAAEMAALMVGGQDEDGNAPASKMHDLQIPITINVKAGQQQHASPTNGGGDDTTPTW